MKTPVQAAGGEGKDLHRADDSPALIYCRSVYAQLIDWYRVGDSKGQLLLTLNGVFITVLVGAVVARPADLLERKAQLGLTTWVLLAGATLSVVLSVISAVACLHSRLGNARLRRHAEIFIERSGREANYHPAITFWFGTIAHLPRDDGLRLYRSADADFELEALSEEILLLSKNVLAKHRWVNRGWLAAGATLLFLVSSVVSLVVET